MSQTTNDRYRTLVRTYRHKYADGTLQLRDITELLEHFEHLSDEMDVQVVLCKSLVESLKVHKQARNQITRELLDRGYDVEALVRFSPRELVEILVETVGVSTREDGI